MISWDTEQAYRYEPHSWGRPKTDVHIIFADTWYSLTPLTYIYDGKRKTHCTPESCRFRLWKSQSPPVSTSNRCLPVHSHSRGRNFHLLRPKQTLCDDHSWFYRGYRGHDWHRNNQHQTSPRTPRLHLAPRRMRCIQHLELDTSRCQCCGTYETHNC